MEPESCCCQRSWLLDAGCCGGRGGGALVMDARASGVAKGGVRGNRCHCPGASGLGLCLGGVVGGGSG